MAKKEKKGKYLGKRNEELENLYSELNSVDKDTKKGRREFYNVSRKIRKAKEKRILSGLKGFFSRKSPRAIASGPGLAMGFIMPEFQPSDSTGKKGKYLGKREETDILPQDTQIEEILVNATKRAPTILETEEDQWVYLDPMRLGSRVRNSNAGIYSGDFEKHFGNFSKEYSPFKKKNQRYNSETRERLFRAPPDYMEKKAWRMAMPNKGYQEGMAEGGQMNIQQQTQNVANQGRYGDSMLMHVNPAEVRGLSQVMPLTVNPETGQPEAFLPFLAPLIGSMLGPTLFSGMGALGASALGSGLAQWAATGDLKKGLLAGITGYGVGSALQGAGAAAAGTEAAAGQTAALTTDATKTLLQDPNMLTQGTQALNATGQSALNATMAAAQPGIQYAGQAAADAYTGAGTGALKDAFSGTFGEGMQNLAAGASSPLAMSAMYAGMAPTAVMDSEEAYARQMQQMAEEEEESRRQNFLNTPEPILYSAGGGPTNMDPSVQADIAALSMMAGGGRTGYDEGGPLGSYSFPGGYNNFSGDQQRFTPARQTYQINPEFMAGFAPETMYFQPNTLNQPATATTTGGAPVLEDTYQGSKGGYGGMQASVAPTVAIDPYQAYSGQAPAGLQFTQAPPPPEQVAPPPDIPSDTPPPDTPPPDIPGVPTIPGYPDIDWSMIEDNPLGIDWDNFGDLGIPDFKLPPGYMDEYSIDGTGMPSMNSDLPSMDFDLPSSTLPDFSNIDPSQFNLPDGFDPSQFKPPMPQDYGMNNTPFDETLPMDFDSLTVTKNPTMPQVNFDTPFGIDGPPVNQYGENQGFPLPHQFNLPDIIKPMSEDFKKDYFKDDFNTPSPEMFGTAPPIMQPPVAPSMMPPPMQLPMSPEMSMSMEEQLQLMYPENLQQAKLANTRKPSGRRGDRAKRRGGRATGGDTDNNEAMLMEIVQKDPLATEVVMFIQGESDNEQALAQFVEKYGNELFLQLREAVLQNLAPGAQTEGLVEGVGNGGMDDDLNGTIGNQEKIAVSQDEFIVPADVVSMLGDGSSDAGSEELYAMMDRVRQTKTGTTEQAPKLANAGGLLPR